jgi:hypothetical protein
VNILCFLLQFGGWYIISQLYIYFLGTEITCAESFLYTEGSQLINHPGDIYKQHLERHPSSRPPSGVLAGFKLYTDSRPPLGLASLGVYIKLHLETTAATFPIGEKEVN